MTAPFHRNIQEPIPRTLTPGEAESKYLDVLAQIELRRLELKRLDTRKNNLIEEIKKFEDSAVHLRDLAVHS
jgi:hypothetical protein